MKFILSVNTIISILRQIILSNSAYINNVIYSSSLGIVGKLKDPTGKKRANQCTAKLYDLISKI